MNGKSSAFRAALLALALLTLLVGCGKRAEAPAETPAEVPAETPAEVPAEVPAGRQDGERFEGLIVLEGMEETVAYEHARCEALGCELDFPYELLARQSGADFERFVSLWDDAQKPENYLELTRSAESAESAAAAVRAALSQDYALLEGERELALAGACLRIEASELLSGGMADELQMVYIVPAGEGCLVVTAHCAAEAAEGFGRRFAYMLDTLALTEG